MLKENLLLNQLTLWQVITVEIHKYLRQNKDVAVNSPLNKEKVKTEYLKCIGKMWKSQLYAKQQVLFDNIFAIPVLTPIFGTLDWTKDKLEKILWKTRKILTKTGNFHINSNIDPRLILLFNKSKRRKRYG